MFKRIGLIPFIAAAVVALAGCEGGADEVAANNGGSAEATGAAADTALAQRAPTGGVCGTVADIQCAAASDFCKTAAGQCGTQDAEGVCTARPEVCPQDYRPVCGCDGQTYGNACEADRAGVNVQSEGECPGTAQAEANDTAAD